MDAVETLAVMPRRQRTRDSLMPGLRAISVRSYLIFYSAPSDEVVMIARILHGSRNITSKLFPRDPR